MKYPQITYALLVEKNACKEQLALFEEHFGLVEPIPLTSEVVSQFGSLFDINWAARNLLTPEDLAEYNKVSVSAWEEYFKVTAPSWEEYNKVRDTATWIEYAKVRDTTISEHEKTFAVAFVEIYKRGLKR